MSVKNVIKMKGIQELPIYSVDGKGNKYFDFNKLIPMPVKLAIVSMDFLDQKIIYYLTEKFTIPFTSLGPEVYPFLQRVFKHKGVDAAYTYAVQRFGAEQDPSVKEKLYEEGKTLVNNYHKYGVTNIFDWCCREWGTIMQYECGVEFLDDDTIRFETVNACPEPVIKKLSCLYPNVKIEHWWAGVKPGRYTGYYYYMHGESFGGADYNVAPQCYEHYLICRGETKCCYRGENGICVDLVISCDSCDGCAHMAPMLMGDFS